VIPFARRPWIRVAILAGGAYLLIGRAFSSPAFSGRPWRLAAWGLGGVVFLVHLWFEGFRLRNTPRTAATHVASGVALGAFALAAAAMIRATSDPSEVQPKWLLALVLWPALTAIPAFFVALVSGLLLARARAARSATVEPQ
jgi:hypothetical protein